MKKSIAMRLLTTFENKLKRATALRWCMLLSGHHTYRTLAISFIIQNEQLLDLSLERLNSATKQERKDQIIDHLLGKMCHCLITTSSISPETVTPVPVYTGS